MTRAGITGNIGTGKTTVCRIFESLGIKVYYADREARKFYADPEVARKVVALAGKQVYDDRMELRPGVLAGIVFNDEEKLKQLNAIIHPMVLEDFFSWAGRHADKEYILYESALLFESGFIKHFDYSILVTAPELLAMKRVMERDRIDEAGFLARARRQLGQEEKLSGADFVIDNSGNRPLIPQVVDIHHAIRQQA